MPLQAQDNIETCRDNIFFSHFYHGNITLTTNIVTSLATKSLVLLIPVTVMRLSGVRN